ncbi:hypothetical protein [Mucilaginibacter gossypii]|uniref:Uncharacterized protein n=1 Tax=Mucilaginibacter gossypii TaxID=551996 RepID=A0A1G7XJ30_9SPHI|nr:hypothetical protein [Mucilaginibacter gossypii]SDG84202.1 hypothetical protein SAMN05192573_10579 [Mucilaginibacter gossypii]
MTEEDTPTMDEFYKRTGYVIVITIELEKFLDDFLSKHFCFQINRQEEFKNLILYNERITLDFKRELFTLILKNEYKDILKTHPTVITDLGRLPEHRNRFAHLKKVGILEIKELITRKTQVWSGINGDKTIVVTENTIIFKRYKNGSVKFLGYGENEIQEMKGQLTNIAKCFIEIYKIMEERYMNLQSDIAKIRIETLIDIKEKILNTDRDGQL